MPTSSVDERKNEGSNDEKMCEAACLFWRGTENPIAFESDMIFKVETEDLSSRDMIFKVGGLSIKTTVT